MATNSSILAWRIPETGEPGGLPSMGLHRVGHDWSDLAAALSYVSFLCVLDINFMSDMRFANIFSYFIGCLFHFVDYFFCCTESFKLDVLTLVYFCFLLVYSVAILKYFKILCICNISYQFLLFKCCFDTNTLCSSCKHFKSSALKFFIFFPRKALGIVYL